MDQHIEAYLQYCAAMKLSKASINNYSRALTFFADHLASHDRSLTSAQPRDVTDFMTAHADWDAATTANRLSALRGFYKWAQIRGILDGENPMLEIRSPKQHQKRNKPTVTQDEVHLLLETQRIHRDGTALPTDLRDRCIIALIYDTGIRVAEVASLNVGHIQSMDAEKREFVYVGKGGSEYTWYVTPDVYEMLLRYINTLDTPEPEQPLFCNRGGQRLSIRYIQKILADRGKNVLGRHLHPHMLRRGVGNAFYSASGHDIYATSQALHHASVTTTQGYLAVGQDNLRKIMDGMSAKRTPASP